MARTYRADPKMRRGGSLRALPWATGLGIVAIICWASTAGLYRLAADTFGPFGAGAIAYGTASLLIVAVYWKEAGRLRGNRSYWRIAPLYLSYLVALGMAIGLAGSVEEVAQVALINYLWPTLVVALSAPRKGRTGTIAGCLIALSGVILASGGLPAADVHWLRVGLAGWAAIAWALYSVLLQSRPPPTPLTNSVILGAAALGLAGFWGTEGAFTDGATEGWVAALLLGALTAVGYALWDRAMVHGNRLLLGFAGNFTPIVALLVLGLLTGGGITGAAWAGCALVVVGSVLGWLVSRGSRAGH